jgi:endonuclease/exonuclease/phosphatase (EEP) superfamily protein YafD
MARARLALASSVKEKLPVILFGLAALGTLGSPLGIWSSHLERMSHFRLGWVGLLLGLAWWFLRGRRRCLAIAATVVTAVSVAPLFPYWLPGPRAESGTGIKFIAWNVLWENPRKHEALPWLLKENADVLLLTECTFEWREKLASLKETHPHHFHSGRDSAEGMWLLSRFPMNPPDPDGLAAAKPWISTVLHTPQGPVRVIGLHPRTPRSGARFDQRNAQYDHTAAISADAGMPVVVLGDLNCTPFSPWFRRLLDRGKLRDSGIGHGLPPTWRSYGIGLPIDHILISGGWSVLERTVHPERMGSDHHPVIAVLSGKAG